MLRPSSQRGHLSSSPRKALFIVMEGVDGSGKTFHMEIVQELMAKHHYPVRMVTYTNSQTKLCFLEPASKKQESFMRGQNAFCFHSSTYENDGKRRCNPSPKKVTMFSDKCIDVLLVRQNYLPPPRRPNFGRSREGYGRHDFPVFSRIWVSTVDLGDPELDFALGRWW